MGKITVVISDELEDQVREHLRKRGDLSRIVEEGLKKWLAEEKVETSDPEKDQDHQER